MNFIKSIISYIIVLSVALSLFGCNAKSNSVLLSSSALNQVFSEELKKDEGKEDKAESDIQNNSGKIEFSAPQNEELTLYDSYVYFNGICNKKFPLMMNGKAQEISEEGYFSIKYDLNLGSNEITFTNGEFTKTFKINYILPLIKSYTPSDDVLNLDGGTSLSITVVAKSGSTAKVKYNGESTSLTPKSDTDSQYVTYKGVITTAKSGSSSVKITVKNGDNSQTVTASQIVIKAKSAHTSSPSPIKSLQNKGYVNVGKKYIAEVKATTAEGFLGGTVDDYSRPTVNYLPKGTVDYCSPSKIYDSESGKSYYLLRNNTRVYSKKSNVKVCKGNLPSRNNLKYSGGGVSGNHFLMKFKVDWKAPFRFVLGPQGYNSEKSQDYSISATAFTYVDITFCYANSLEDFALSSNPIFKGYKIFKNTNDYTLRLYLKNKGKFWGWSASYNSNGELVFSFLNPAKITPADNEYGYSLKGIKITIDAGHGGEESGTYNAVNSNYYEKYYTLLYAKELANQLLKLGATVYMTRLEDKTMSLAKRYNYITATGADLAISIHFNGSANGSTNGYFMGYFNPYTYTAAKCISNSIASTGLIGRERDGIDWHYFNLSRVSACPVVLAENGYLTGISDYKKIKTVEFRKAYIKGMVEGIIDYFARVGNYSIYDKTPDGSVSSTLEKEESDKSNSSYTISEPNSKNEDSKTNNSSTNNTSKFSQSTTSSVQSHVLTRPITPTAPSRPRPSSSQVSSITNSDSYASLPQTSSSEVAGSSLESIESADSILSSSNNTSQNESNTSAFPSDIQ